MPQTQPTPQKESQEELLTQQADNYQIMLYNDDYNTFDYVIELLIEICDHTYEQAEQCAVLVHFSGKCPVKEGSYEDLLPRCSKLTVTSKDKDAIHSDENLTVTGGTLE
ncbi:MAG: ATP-dependent Clp protease adaptor ClpS, partial [Capnocytophaga gingivalis]